MLKNIISVTAGFAIMGMIFFTGCTKTTTVVQETTIPTDTATISFSKDIQPLFTASCALSGCHVSGAQVPNLSKGFAYQALFDEDMIVPFDPANSELMGWLTGKLSPVMPLGSGPNEVINEKVYNWIKQGALNN
jgi:hypothetical protein